VDSARVYFTTVFGWSVLPIGAAGAAPQSFSTMGPAQVPALALDGTSLFFRSTDPVSQKMAFWRIPAGVVAPAQAVMLPIFSPNDAFTVDASNIYYWSDALYRVAKTGGTPQKLSATVDNVGKMLIHAEGGGRAIYWVNQGNASGSPGSVLKLAL
jgi:hypothetical protein